MNFTRASYTSEKRYINCTWTGIGAFKWLGNLISGRLATVEIRLLEVSQSKVSIRVSNFERVNSRADLFPFALTSQLPWRKILQERLFSKGFLDWMVFGLFEKDFNHRNSISQLVSHKIKKKVLSSSQFFAILAMERESLLVRCHLSNVDYIM